MRSAHSLQKMPERKDGAKEEKDGPANEASPGEAECRGGRNRGWGGGGSGGSAGTGGQEGMDNLVVKLVCLSGL